MERNEAIDVVKRNYPHVTESGSQFETALRTLIPELKESEDKKIIKALKLFFELQDDNTTFSLVPKKDILAWLEKQGRQRHAEWSEEDKEMQLEAIKYLELFDAQGIHGNKAVPVINWLKSLSPQNHWKPSEEQMDALGTAVSSLQSTTLESLYRNLKML